MKNKKPLGIILIVFILELVAVEVWGFCFRQQINLLINKIDSGVIINFTQTNEELSKLLNITNIVMIAGGIIFLLITAGIFVFKHNNQNGDDFKDI